MRTSCIRLVAALGFLSALSMAGAPARAQLPPIGNPGIPGLPGTPVCPPNSSCAPGTPTPPTNPPGACGPGPGGATCGGAGPAAMGGSTGVNVGAGNPINIINGNKYQREVDMAPLPGVLGLEIVRHYNSSLSGPGASTNLVGRGWKLSYETDLYVSGRTLQVVQADGSRIIFNRDARDPSLCASDNAADGRITVRKTARGEEYVWRWINGRELSFDSRGKLVQILAPGGQFVSLQHDARGLLVSVTAPQGRRLQLQYLDKAQGAAGTAFRGVQSIVSPVGTFRYRYGSPAPEGAQVAASTLLANLVKVEMPTGARYYHYESPRFPTYLTGISELASNAQGKAAWQRVSTYGYDDNGKGNLSVKGFPARLARDAGGKLVQPARLVTGTGVQQITLEHGAGTTTLTNSLGQKTVYRHAVIAGQYRLLEALGAGCTTCGETNVRYGYDDAGRLVAMMKLDAKGIVLSAESTQYDAQGRARQLTSYAYANGKPLPGKLKMRVEYEGDKVWPVRIVRPSVVPGQDYLTSIKYAESATLTGLPTEISEEGHIPTLTGTASAGTVARTLRYRYDDYGQRVEVDGPLPNAVTGASPLNSDITRIRFDARTKMVLRTEEPGGSVSEVLERDAALRPTVTRFTDAAAVQLVRLRYNWRGQPEEMRVESMPADGSPALSQTIRYTYGLNGKLLGTTMPGELTSRFIYDAAGRMTRKVLPDGSSVEAVYDTEGRRTSSAVLDADGRRAGFMHFHLDAAGNVVGMEDGLGVFAQASFTPAGAVAEMTNALGVATLFSYDDDGLLVSRTSAQGTPDAGSIGFAYDARGNQIKLTDANGVTTLRRYDDFGRRVVEVNPDRGATLYLHDPAGRMVARTDARGSETRFRYDLQGRMIAVGNPTVPELTRYRYAGRRMVEMVATTDGKPEHAFERTSYRFDALGNVLEEKRWYAKVGQESAGKGLNFVTTSTYDAAGRLSTQVLPDGHQLRYQYADKSGGLAAMFFDDEPVVTNIERAPIGMTAFEAGNGVRQRIERDVRGRITAVRAEGGPIAGRGLWAQLRTWFGAGPNPAMQTIYAQDNRYDAGGRMLQVDRKLAPAGALPLRSVTEQYEYDALDRLTNVKASDGPTVRYAYDRGGNRILEAHQPMLVRTSSDAAAQAGTRRYMYATGTNRLTTLTRIQLDDQDNGMTAANDLRRIVDTAWVYRPGGAAFGRIGFALPGRAAAGVPAASAGRRIAYDNANRAIGVFDAADQPVASYSYNAQGERYAQTVYPAPAHAGNVVRAAYRTGQAGLTTYSLYRDRRLAAEADGEGHITAHYLYLEGRPIARIDMRANDGLLSRMWQALRSIGSTNGQQPDPSASLATIYAIHSDHLGTPQAVTDAHQAIVWQARVSPFGQARVVHAAVAAGTGKAFEMNLRLPGQVYDTVTGLHQNYMRDYDPALGRYTTPDPLGLAGGINPYMYVGNNPLTNIDPLGLFQIDVHYYVTYYLAIKAGLSQEDALQIALATQYVDDNPHTSPMPLGGGVLVMANILANKDALMSYHFVLSEGNTRSSNYGETLDKYRNTDIHSVEGPSGLSPQLQRLFDASQITQACAARNQFFGEFLHAFQDTYSHRDYDNKPVDATKELLGIELGVGHGQDFTHPDMTFDPGERMSLTSNGVKNWTGNDERTLAMELATFKKLQEYAGTTDKDVDMLELIAVLDAFNTTREDEGGKVGEGQGTLFAGADVKNASGSSENSPSDKLRILNESLGEGNAIPYYSINAGCTNRKNSIAGLPQDLYKGTILKTPAICPTVRSE